MNELLVGVAVGLTIAVVLIGSLVIARSAYHAFRKRKEVAVMTSEQVSQDALPTDPDDLPRFLTFRPKNGYTRSCDCHERPLADGDTVLFWPTGTTTIVFCEDGVRENVATE